MLVPLFGTDLDDDIVQTAARLVSGEPTDEAAIDTATIEAMWIFVIPMSLPLDASLPDAQIKHARQVLARAKAVGEEYTGVHVATATVRTRRAGLRDRRRGAPPRRGGDRAGRRGTVADPRRRPARGARRSAGGARRGRHQVRRQQGPLPRDRHGAAGTATRAGRPATPSPSRPGRRTGSAPASSNLRAMFVLIVGAGRVGSAVAKSALAAGHEVSVLDEDPLSHERLDAGQDKSWEDSGGQFTVGTALEIDALIQAGIERADVFIASTGGRQHEPRDRPDRAEALRRGEDDRAGHGPGARQLVRRAGPAHDLPDQARDRDVRARARARAERV